MPPNERYPWVCPVCGQSYDEISNDSVLWHLADHSKQ